MLIIIAGSSADFFRFNRDSTFFNNPVFFTRIALDTVTKVASII